MRLGLNIKLSLVLVVLIPVYMLVSYTLHIKTKDSYKKHQENLGDMMGYFGDSLVNRMMLKAFVKEGYAKKRFKDYNDKQKNSYLSSRFLMELSHPINSFITTIFQIGIFVYAGFLVYAGDIDIGSFTIFILYFQLFKKPIMSIGNTLNSIEIALACLDRIYEILDFPYNKKEDYPEITNDLEIIFNNVSYKKIRNFNLKINQGDIITVTGDNKENFIKLLIGQIEADEGTVLINNLNIYDYDIISNNALIGLSIDYQVFNGTILENILCGNTEYSLSDVKNVCKILNVDKIIESFPDKYNTRISQETHILSTSQKELICLARACIFNPRILIFNYHDYLSNEALKEITKNKTTIILNSDKDHIKISDKTIEV